ncbi:MAG TPA: hypothetical protein PKH39_10680 [Woeseiaceae bacterium]|nr:hypothetical protein [Woeseiaceae bacterium]
MLLRSVIQHVKDQNWFAVGIDFVIVVVGVYIGIQVSNWNDEIRVQSLEASYLTRVADELKSNIEMFDSQAKFSRESRSVLGNFIASIDSQSSSDADLVSHTSEYLSSGVFFTKFTPSQTTFDELKSTGNLDIIKDKAIREALVELHVYYESGTDVVESNTDWVLQSEDTVYLSFDALRFDERTSALFSQRSTAEMALQIRENKDLLIRHAALHYWIKDRALEILEGATELSDSVLRQIESK